MIDFVANFWIEILLACLGAWLFYVIVLSMRRLDPGHNEPLGKRLRKWFKEMLDLILSS